jgi:ATP synthase protein I
VAIWLRKRVSSRAETTRRYTLPAMAGPGNENPWTGLGIGWAIISTLIAGMLVGGGLGYLVDRLVGTSRHVFMGIGIVVGAAGGIYIVYLRFGRGGS